ncbi:MAG: THO complex subunit 7 family protein [Planctomycetota bacterium]|jgi:hypothetical protein
MFDDDLDSQSTPATMFPFLSVLFCTIGALAIIMVIGSLRTTVKDEGVDVRLDSVRMRAKELAKLQGYVVAMEESISDISAANSASISLSDEADAWTSNLEEERVGLADLVAKGSEDEIYVEKADLARIRHTKLAAHETTLTTWRANKAEVDGARSEKAELDTQIGAAKSEIEKLKQEADRPVVRFSFGESPDGRKPVLLELKADGVLVRSDGAPRPEGALVPKDEASARAGFLEKLAASLTRPGADRYAVLFVRPGAVDLFFAATERLRKRRAPYAAEPVEGNWKLDFGSGGASPN